MQTIFLSPGKKCPIFSAEYNGQNQTRNYKSTRTSNFTLLSKKRSPDNWTIILSLNEDSFSHAN